MLFFTRPQLSASKPQQDCRFYLTMARDQYQVAAVAGPMLLPITSLLADDQSTASTALSVVSTISVTCLETIVEVR